MTLCPNLDYLIVWIILQFLVMVEFSTINGYHYDVQFCKIEVRATVVAAQQPLVEYTAILNHVYCLTQPTSLCSDSTVYVRLYSLFYRIFTTLFRLVP